MTNVSGDEKSNNEYAASVDVAGVNAAMAVNAGATNATSQREDLLAFLEAAEDKNFVFFFGTPAAGKSAVLGSMIQAMNHPDSFGTLSVHGVGNGYFSEGQQLWDRLQAAFANRRFPPRTAAGKTIQLHATFKPHFRDSQSPLEIVFLEMGGEDLRQVSIGNHVLPAHINQFLRIKKLKLMFIMTAAWSDARKDDKKIGSFLDYLNERSPHLVESRVILLLTKWDTRPPSAKENVHDFVKKSMPETYSKLSSSRNVISDFSIGDILPERDDGIEDPNDIIQEFNFPVARSLFNRIQETFSGINYEALPKKTLFGRLFG